MTVNKDPFVFFNPPGEQSPIDPPLTVRGGGLFIGQSPTFRGYSMDKVNAFASALISGLELSELRWLVDTLQDYLDTLDNGGWEKVWYNEDGSPKTRPSETD